MESQAHKKLKVLIIANSRFKGGLSGGDAIYESFLKFWKDVDFDIWTLEGIDYKPFWICYLHRICITVIRSLFNFSKYDMVYTASDFLPDSLGGFIFRLKGTPWIAGFYLKAFKENRIHWHTQKMVRKLIEWFADMVIVTNPTMFDIFPNKKKTWINGGIDLKLAGLSDKPKIYDAVFCGRIHTSKGIDELIEIWQQVRKQKGNATLAVIGDGDLGVDYIKKRMGKNMGITYFGYMGNERYEVFKQSKVVLYPTPLKYDHFSMAPVEAMACGCVMLAFNTKVMRYIMPFGTFFTENIKDYSSLFIKLISDEFMLKETSKEAIEWSQQFDYEKQSTRVFNDIKEILNENIGSRSSWDGRNRPLRVA